MRQAAQRARRLELAFLRRKTLLARQARRQIGELRDDVRFSLEWASKPLSIGALSPSGQHLARMMAAQVDPATPGMVVELGPGTGAITKALIARGVPQDRLLLVEYNHDFAQLLRKRFPKARIITGDAYDIARLIPQITDEPIAAIVSGLPLFTKPNAQRRKLVHDAMQLLGAGARGAFIQFTYAIVPPVARDPAHYSLRGTRRVWWNLFPAKVWVYRPAA